MTANDRIDWRDFFKIAVGMMGMKPKTFFNLSPVELYLAIDGFKSFNSADEQKTEGPMTSDRMRELMELYPDK